MTTRRRIEKDTELGEILREAREAKDLPKTKASDELGVHRMTYDHWKRGFWVPKVEHAETIANFTGLDRVEVLTLLLRMNGFLDYDQYLTAKRHN